MKQPDERAIIEAHFKEHWAGETPVQLENVPFERPADAPYISFWVLPEGGRQISAGKEPVWLFDGRIEAVVNFPLEKLDRRRQKALVDRIKEIFRGALLDGIQIGDDVQVSEKEISGWHRTRIEFRMQWEEKNGRRVAS